VKVWVESWVRGRAIESVGGWVGGWVSEERVNGWVSE